MPSRLSRLNLRIRSQTPRATAHEGKKNGVAFGPPSWGGGNREDPGGPPTPLAASRPFDRYFCMYSRLNASASSRVRSASFIFLSLSVTSSTRAYTKSRIAARTASERLGKSSTSTRKSSAFRYRGGRRNVIFSESASRMFSALHRRSKRHRLPDERPAKQLHRI